jgi:hypothetical protein
LTLILTRTRTWIYIAVSTPHHAPQLPTKKERSAVEAVEAVLEAERKEGRAREARHKLTVERLRRQLLEQQVRRGGVGARVLRLGS